MISQIPSYHISAWKCDIDYQASKQVLHNTMAKTELLYLKNVGEDGSNGFEMNIRHPGQLKK